MTLEIMKEAMTAALVVTLFLSPGVWFMLTLLFLTGPAK